MSSSISSSRELTGADGPRCPRRGAGRGWQRAELAKVCLFPLFLAGLCWLQEEALLAGLRRFSTGKLGVWNKVLDGRVNAQVVASGSSRALVHFDPRILQDTTGRTAFNLGRDGGQLALQLAFLRTYLEHNHRPDWLLQEVDINSLAAPRDLFEPWQYVPCLGEPAIYEAVSEVDGVFEYYRRLPLLGIARERLFIPAVRGLLGRCGGEDEYLGYRPMAAVWREDFAAFRRAHPDGVGFAIDEGPRTALRGILSLCRRSGIRAVLIYSPEYCESQLLTTNRDQVFAVFHQVADEFGVPFWDYSGDVMCQDTSYFYNSQHLNRRGATEFSREIGIRLKEEMDRALATR